MVKILCIIVFSLFTNQIFAGHAEQAAQLLHNKISKDLLSIKKEYPQTQPKVYSLLDQVCKMYKISKSAITGKKTLKAKLKNKDLENTLLKGENTNLKNEISELRNDLQSTQQNISSIAKKLEQKNIILSMANKEKEKLQQEKIRLEEEKQFYLQQNTKVNAENNNLENKTTKQAHHSLNLTSTSAPTSPL